MKPKFGGAVLLLYLGQAAFFAANVRAQQTADATAEPLIATKAASRAVDAAPSVKEIVAKSVEALGGRDAWARPKSRRLKGLFQTEDSSMFVGLEILQKAPSKSLSKVSLPNGVMIREVCDGKTAWIEDARGGYHEFKGAALTYRVKQADFLANIKIFDVAANGKFIGTQKVGTHTTYVVEYAEGKNQARLYFDTESGFVVHVEDVFMTDEGPYTVKTDLDDYRDVDGLKFPFRVKRTEKGAVTTMRLTQVTLNPQIEDDIFLKPETAKR